MIASGYDFEVDGKYYYIKSAADKTVVLTYNNYASGEYSGDFVIPETITYNNIVFKVVGCDWDTFRQCEITSIHIPIGFSSFDYNYNWIYGSVFYNPDVILRVYVPNLETWMNISYTHSNAFGTPYELYVNNAKLENVVIPEGTTTIPYEKFGKCNSIKTVKLSNSVKKIGIQAFAECDNLVKVECNDGLEELSINAFYRDGNLKEINIPHTVYSIGNACFYQCSSLLSKIVIPEGITDIKSASFFECTGLTEISIPSTVTMIYQNAFTSCSSLKDIYVNNTTPPLCNEIEDGAYTIFNGVDKFNCIIHVPKGAVGLYKNASEWNQFFYIIDDISKPVYKLIYQVDGIEYKTYEIEYGTTIVPEPTPTKEGYSFSGWSEIPETMPAHDVTVTGTFSINKYKLTYMVDGEEHKSYEVEYGANITPEVAPTKEGYTFSGWSEIPETMPAHDVTVTGTFCINKYDLTYTVDGEEYKSYEVEYGATITPEPAPTKEGHTFSGWSEIPETMPAHDVTVTGTFNIEKYKLTYTVDGEEYKNYEMEYGATITPEAEPTKEGYTFSGWSEIPETMPAHDVTVTGSFSINKYTLTYTVDGEEYKNYEVEYGATITPETEPTKEGYTFSGWSEIPETMPAHDVTVTGTFSINKYKLTYTVDGEEYKSYEMEYGAIITPETEPTKEGYTFSGWSEIPETMPAHDVTVTGTFSINKYKLTYTVDGEEYKSYEMEYGAIITPETEPTKEGYTFSGWSDIPETMPAYDVIVMGSFTINSYKLTYMIDDIVYKETMYEYGDNITPEPQPEGDYQTFEWVDLPLTMPAHNVVVHASYTSGIIEVLIATQHNMRIYSPNGQKLDKPKKGLNIVIFDNGTIKKLIIK